jgi:propanol-preferring alcohol dehydrogenase
LIPGHQIVGVAENDAPGFGKGTRVGVPWLGWTCGVCRWCTSERENLCDTARFTGYTVDGGYAEYAVADARYCFPLPETYSAEEAAPLLCAGLIGFRAYRMIGDARRLGVYGFGSAAQIIAQIARADGREVFAFTRANDRAAQDLAMSMGAFWAGDSDAQQELDAAIIFAPVGGLVVNALRNVAKGGTIVCAGIHMSDIPSFPYELLWGERSVRSVANLTRADAHDLFARLETLRLQTKRTVFSLEKANEALTALRAGHMTGTAVLKVTS